MERTVRRLNSARDERVSGRRVLGARGDRAVVQAFKRSWLGWNEAARGVSRIERWEMTEGRAGAWTDEARDVMKMRERERDGQKRGCVAVVGAGVGF